MKSHINEKELKEFYEFLRKTGTIRKGNEFNTLLYKYKGFLNKNHLENTKKHEDDKKNGVVCIYSMNYDASEMCEKVIPRRIYCDGKYKECEKYEINKDIDFNREMKVFRALSLEKETIDDLFDIKN